MTRTGRKKNAFLLGGRYTIKTVNGYSLAQENCGDLFACMKKNNDEVNVFALESTTVENEIGKISSEGGEVTGQGLLILETVNP